MSRLIISLDGLKDRELKRAVDVDPDTIWGFKVSNDLIFKCGMCYVKTLKRDGFRVMLDCKFHDIPSKINTYIEECYDDVDLLTVHISSDYLPARDYKSKIVGVTLLTSFDDMQSQKVYNKSVAPNITNLSSLAYIYGYKHLVCSASDIKYLFYKPETIICPAIDSERFTRLNIEGVNDQKRTVTLTEAVKLGADLIVVGRGLTPYLYERNAYYESIEYINATIKQTLEDKVK